MNGTVRSRFLLSKLEEVLSSAQFLRNPLLCSQLTPSNRIPITTVADLPAMRKVNATVDEILDSCSLSQMLAVVGTEFIAPLFEVRPECLILNGIGDLGSAFELRDFIAYLKGDSNFTTFPTNDGRDFAVHCDSTKEAIAIWRFLSIVPFRGRILDVSVYSPSASFGAKTGETATVAQDKGQNRPQLPTIEPKTRAMPAIAFQFPKGGTGPGNPS